MDEFWVNAYIVACDVEYSDKGGLFPFLFLG